MFRSLVPLLESTFPRSASLDPQSFTQGVLWPAMRRGYMFEHRDHRPDVEALLVIKEALMKMMAMNAQALTPSIKVLADASRDSWSSALILPSSADSRQAFGDYHSDSLASWSSRPTSLALNTASIDLRTQVLRIIGNCCGDTGIACFVSLSRHAQH